MARTRAIQLNSQMITMIHPNIYQNQPPNFIKYPKVTPQMMKCCFISLDLGKGNVLTPRAKMKGSQHRGQGSKGLTKGKTFKLGCNLAKVAHKTKECLYRIIVMHMLIVISKRIKASFRDVIMEGTHMKEKYETKLTD